MKRRQFLYLAASAGAITGLSRAASALSYPTRPVHWIVGFAPGGGNDIIARVIGQSLSHRLGQPFVIENRPGASTNLATEMVVRAVPDGYTLLLVGANNASNAALDDKLSFNFLRDIAPVAGLGRAPLVMVVNPSIPARTVPELVSYAKANPNKLNMASAGIGSIGHLAGELFKMTAGVDLVHVPYRGNGPILAALLGGEVQVGFPSLTSSIAYIKTGKLNALAVTSATRAETEPDIPAVGEFVPGYEISTWYGVGAPRGTPAEVVDNLNRQINAVLADPEIKARFAALGDVPMPMTPAEFGKFTADVTEKLTKVVKFAGIKPS